MAEKVVFAAVLGMVELWMPETYFSIIHCLLRGKLNLGS